MIIQESQHDFDVAILGNGLSGSLLATILGKQGVSVVLIDADQSPSGDDNPGVIAHLSNVSEVEELPQVSWSIASEENGL